MVKKTVRKQKKKTKIDVIVQCVLEFCKCCPFRYKIKRKRGEEMIKRDSCRGYDPKHKIPCELLPIFKHYDFKFSEESSGAPSAHWTLVRRMLKAGGGD